MSKRYKKFAQAWAKAHKKGLEAGRDHGPTPMLVQEHENPLNDNSPVKKQYLVAEGLCGFAWVVVQPGTSSFARWLKREGIARKHYHGGVSIWCNHFGQSYERKREWAQEVANVLSEELVDENLTIYSGSRLD